MLSSGGISHIHHIRWSFHIHTPPNRHIYHNLFRNFISPLMSIFRRELIFAVVEISRPCLRIALGRVFIIWSENIYALVHFTFIIGVIICITFMKGQTFPYIKYVSFGKYYVHFWTGRNLLAFCVEILNINMSTTCIILAIDASTDIYTY